MCNMPGSAIREKCKTLIGAHVNYPGTRKSFKARELPERIFVLGINQNVKPEIAICDYLIDPPGMQNFSMLDFSSGYEYTLKMIEDGKLKV